MDRDVIPNSLQNIQRRECRLHCARLVITLDSHFVSDTNALALSLAVLSYSAYTESFRGPNISLTITALTSH